MNNTLSWIYTTDINSTRTLFEKEILPYTIEVYSCSCSHKEIIIKSNYQEQEYICKVCENNKFLDANYFLGNTAWYDPIEDVFSKELLENLPLTINKDIINNKLFASITLEIPNNIDISCDKISFLKKEIFQVSIDEFGNMKEKLFANFDLNDNWYYFNYKTQEEIIDKHSILSGYKKRICHNIINSNYFNLSSNINEKVTTIEEISFFVKNTHLKEFEFLYWKEIDYLPLEKVSTIYDALNYILNNRKEKSLKKAIFENYQEQMIGKSYYFIYPYCITKYIKDTNIAKRLLDLDFNKYFKEIINHHSLEYFLEYLTKHFSDKQILNLFKSYLKQELFWFVDTLELFAELDDNMRENFEKIHCKYDILHDEIVEYHRLAVEHRLLDIKFNYMQNQIDACVQIEQFEVKLPIDGVDLYNWSNILNNCLAGYGEIINSYYTTVYGFFKNDKLVFAVEIQNNKLVQARSKYNQDLAQEDKAVLIKWYEEFILIDKISPY